MWPGQLGGLEVYVCAHAHAHPTEVRRRPLELELRAAIGSNSEQEVLLRSEASLSSLPEFSDGDRDEWVLMMTCELGRSPLSFEGSMPQCGGMPGSGSRSRWVGEQEEEEIG